MARLGRSFPIRPHMNYQGRTGIYFNIAKISGAVTLASVGVSGALVRCVRASDNTVVATTTTDGSGLYSFSGSGITVGQTYHVFVEYTSGVPDKYNAKSLWAISPYVTT